MSVGQRGACMDCGIWPQVRIPAGRSGGCFRLGLGVWWGWPPDWLLSRLQDSDGDKSDDLVVDVSNEVSADRPR